MLRQIDTELELRAVEGGELPEVYGRIVPFGVRAHITELDDTGALDEYDEEFLPGCTEAMRQRGASARGGKLNWIRFTLDHEQALDHRIGFCRHLEELDDGAYATFELYPPRAELARSMLGTSHTGLSIEFHDLRRHPPTGPLRQRTSIQIKAVTATPVPIYAGAGVLAMRADTDPLDGGPTPRLAAALATLEAERARYPRRPASNTITVRAERLTTGELAS